MSYYYGKIRYDTPYLVVGYYPPFGFILVDSIEDELKINMYTDSDHCLDSVRLLREAYYQLHTEPNVSNFRIAGIFKDGSLLETNTNIQLEIRN